MSIEMNPIVESFMEEAPSAILETAIADAITDFLTFESDDETVAAFESLASELEKDADVSEEVLDAMDQMIYPYFESVVTHYAPLMELRVPSATPKMATTASGAAEARRDFAAQKRADAQASYNKHAKKALEMRKNMGVMATAMRRLKKSSVGQAIRTGIKNFKSGMSDKVQKVRNAVSGALASKKEKKSDPLSLPAPAPA